MTSTKCPHCQRWIGPFEVHEDCARKQDEARGVAQPHCDHGITFDEEEAKRVLSETKEQLSGDAAVDFIMGPVNATAIIKRRWPRGFFTKEKPCPKGCGYQGIYYASYAHYIYGDW